jgi:hypothetical protein
MTLKIQQTNMQYSVLTKFICSPSAHLFFSWINPRICCSATKLHNSLAGLLEHLQGEGQHQPHRVGIVEALAGKAEDALLGHEVFDELQVGLELGEAGHVHADHHKHRALEQKRKMEQHSLFKGRW